MEIICQACTTLLGASLWDAFVIFTFLVFCDYITSYYCIFSTNYYKTIIGLLEHIVFSGK